MSSQDQLSTPGTSLTASYTSTHNAPFTVSHQLSLPATAQPDQRSKFLADLRKAAAATQDQVNKELTQRMEEDKAREESGKPGTKKKDDEAEEENYGEEVVEDSD